MASTVYSEPPASRLSIALEGEASASPFPSPSSSFLPPPTPGAHEFAVKPAPARIGRKLSATAHGAAASPVSTTETSSASTMAATTTGTTTATTTTNGDAVHSTPRNDYNIETENENGKQPSPNTIPTNGILKSSPTSSSLSSSSSPEATTITTTTTNGQPPAPTPMSLSTKSVLHTQLSAEPPSPTLLSPLTPTPYTLYHNTNSTTTAPKSPVVEQSTSSSTTPTILTVALPPEDNSSTTQSSDNNNSNTMDVAAKYGEDSPAQIIIPSNLDAGLISFSAAPTPSSPSSPAFNTRPMSASLNSNRPAPPSPAMSRRVSGVPSLSSNASNSASNSGSGGSGGGGGKRGSRPSSQVISMSRSNSLRKSSGGGGGASRGASPVIQPHRLSQSFVPPISPQHLTFALNVSQSSSSQSQFQSQAQGLISPLTPSTPTTATARTSIPPPSTSTTATPPPTAVQIATPKIYIQIRDFGFPPSDERHIGLGPDVPKPNIVRRLNRKLGPARTSMGSTGSVASSDGDGEEEEEGWGDDDDGEGSGYGGGGGWGGGLLGRLSWLGAAAAVAGDRTASTDGSMPTQTEMDINFGGSADDAEGEGQYDDDEDMGEGYGGEEEDTLYPGLYRAVYAFEPEGIAEMRLVEDQIVRVVGRGGGVGWAVVVDESASAAAASEGAEGDVTEGEEREKVVKHALVPESYLEPVRLDWEDEEGVIVGA